MSTATHSEPSPGSLGVAGARVLLVALAIGCLLSFWSLNHHTDDYRLRYPLFVPWLWNLYLTFYLAGVFASFTVWNWRKWGVWLLIAMGVAMLFTEIYAMGFTFHSLRIPVVLAGVWFGLQPVWRRLH